MDVGIKIQLSLISVFAAWGYIVIRMCRTRTLPLEPPWRMAALHKRRRDLGDRKSSPGGASSKSKRAASSEDSSVFVKLLAAGFYGISSFLIVVVNKSVLTNYR